MTDNDLSKTPGGLPPVNTEEQLKQREKVFGILVENLKPWLLEFGNWIFGGLIAFTVVVVAALFAVGPQHRAIVVSIAALACAIPLNISGLFCLKLVSDMKTIGIDAVMRQAFQDASAANVDSHFPPVEEDEALYKRRTDVVLRYSVRLAALSVLVTVLGTASALWYMAWWVAVVFLAVVVVSSFVTVRVVVHMLRPASEAEKQLRLRHREQRRTP